MENNDPEVIRHQMEETRASLSEKLETLEHEVVETVHQAAATVTDTVASVKEAVHESVATVKDSVSETVETVKETFDLNRQFDHHPWTMFGGSVFLGFLGGCLLPKAGSRMAVAPAYHPGAFSDQFAPVHRNGGTEGSAPGKFRQANGATADYSSQASQPSWLSELSEKFGPEISKLKGLAIGTMMGVLRDMVAGSISEQLEPKVKELVDSFTKKLGGEPIQGPLVAPREEEASPPREAEEHLRPTEMARPMGSASWQAKTPVGNFCE
jgi:ElaB/YqjD/DUF883 family membrane-anchored ribosome-binding protein